MGRRREVCLFVQIFSPKEESELFFFFFFEKPNTKPLSCSELCPSWSPEANLSLLPAPSPSRFTSGSTFLSRGTIALAAAMAEPHLGL